MPAELAGVARIARLITPTAGLRVLRGDGVGQHPANRLAELRVAGHAQGLAHGESGHGMAIHPLVDRAIAAEVAVRSLGAEQELQPMLCVLVVEALVMRMAGRQERQQRQSGHAGIGFQTGRESIAAGRLQLQTAAVLAGRPPSVGSLGAGQPFQRGPHCLFRFHRGPVALGNLRAVRGDAKAIGRRHVVFFFRVSQRRQLPQLAPPPGVSSAPMVRCPPWIGGVA